MAGRANGEELGNTLDEAEYDRLPDRKLARRGLVCSGGVHGGVRRASEYGVHGGVRRASEYRCADPEHDGGERQCADPCLAMTWK